MEGVIRTLAQPGVVIANLWSNMRYLCDALGTFCSALVMLAAFTALVVRRCNEPFTRRYFLPGFVLFNLAAISFVSGDVSRYIEVYVPFVVLCVAGELHAVTNKLFPARRSHAILAAVPGILLLLIGAAVMPHLNPLRLGPKPQGRMQACSGFRERSPVFGLHPYETYLVGGRFRILPNDRLEKVVAYARKTDVQWLVVDKAAGSARRLYSHADWYFEPDLHRRYPGLVKFQCAAPGGRFVLFHIESGGG